MSGAVHVLVPLKRFDDAKSRLAGLLTVEERGELMRAMLANVLAAVSETPGVSAVTLVSSEGAADRLAAEHGVGWFDDRRLPWNEGLAAAMAEGVDASACAIVAADIPLLSPAELECLLGAAPERTLAIARADDGGTNAVVVRPTGAIKTCFGVPGSAARHAELARAAGLVPKIFDLPGMALDLDTPEDLDRFLAVDRPTATRSLVRSLEARHRMAV